MTPEGKVKKKVKDLIAQYPHVYSEWPVPGGYGKSGLDCWGIIDGKAFAVETKRAGQVLTDRQTKCMNEMLAAGGAVFVVAGDDQYGFTQLKAFLDANSVGCTAIRNVPRNNA
ncbi:hypothetical protein PQI07_22650 [Methylobacterium sp. 092160098-2]|uniref:hypothetical protein n=1 Tax=Methylobacterium sp. 092160098-2 TaxID=3025129 RepID=UPI002381CCE3|nr:hypothetical protein [Methylobacterium sp. 092160098-2]MDE4913484.1 hypothetical protein [Methylobacterium sp. 092160098-2]